MKIGILSMQRIVNYGSFLQSYGLKNILEELGHEVEFVDYKIDKPLLASKGDKKNYYKEVVRNKMIDIVSNSKLLTKLLPEKHREVIENINKYKTEFLPLIGVTERKNYNPKLDALIIGSDEVFNVFQKSSRVGYSLELLGKNNNANKLISYAASFGNTSIDKIKSFSKRDEIRECLLQFDGISVRDENSSRIVTELTGIKPNSNFDPVLMYDFSKEIPVVNIKPGYVIVYAYRNRLSENDIQAITEFAKSKNKKIIGLGGYQDFVDEYINASPFELLSYVKNADYVITDTFHGTIFSIINQKKFVSLIRVSKDGSYGNQEKMEDLLNKFGLSSRGVYDPNQIKTIIDQEIDYNSVENIRKQGVKNTLAFLSEHLNK